MKTAHKNLQLNRRHIFGFSRTIFVSSLKLIWFSVFRSRHLARAKFEFAELYSHLIDFAEHSISHLGFNLPSALGDGPVNTVNNLLCQLYGGRYASLSFGGSSGALLTLLIAVLPKLQPDRDLILFDEACHQSTIGGIIFGRWKAVRFPRTRHPDHQTSLPVTAAEFISIIDAHGPERFAAIVLVFPSYDGFRSPSEERKIYAYAKTHGITVIIDGAWDAVRFQNVGPDLPGLEEVCDVWISSPHKRGLTPSSLGCIITQHKRIAQLWDEAFDLGFRSSSVSFVEIMIAEHRLQQIVAGDWNIALSKAEEAANKLRDRVKDIHADLDIVQPSDVRAELSDPAHILISTSHIRNFDARVWAKTLSQNFGIDVEKATASTVLLLCASPSHVDQIENTILMMKEAIQMVLAQTGEKS